MLKEPIHPTIQMESEVIYLREQLAAKEEMLAQTTRFLMSIQNDLKVKNIELEMLNNDIFSSLSFATTIQNSLLPDINTLKVFFKNASYKIYQQLGIGGDSVFIKNTSRGIVFGLFDSTGHGIPAALLSISVSLLLKELMTSMEISNPKILLNLLNYQLYNTFNNSSISVAHMEGIICSYSTNNNMLTYSSAKGKGLLKRANGEIIDLKSSKKSIGDKAEAEFDLFEIEVNPNDKLIMYSDGLIDQFGGNKDKKFTKNRLKELIASIPHNNNANDIINILEYNFTNWKGKNAQTDDVSFIVIDF